MEQFGKYELIRRVGTGGMAEVFLARTTVAQGLNKQLVIKKIHPAYAKSKQFTTMFVDEAKIALSLNHPNIVQVFDFGTVGGTFFLAMEYVEGLDLLRLMQQAAKQKQRVPLHLCAYIVQQVAKGLDYAHRKTDEFGEPFGIVHRDISPQNVLISWDGGVKIVDFGIARASHVQEDEGVVKGKFAYMSPEQARGEAVDRRSDVFSAGVVLFETTCGRPLYPGKGKAVLEKVKVGAIPRPREINPEIPQSLEQTIVKALAFHRDDRFQTARDLQRALGRFQLEAAREDGDLVDSGSLAQWVSQMIPAHKRRPSARPPTAPVAGSLKEAAVLAEPSAEPVARGTQPGNERDTPLPIATPPPLNASRSGLTTSQRKYIFVAHAHVHGLPSLRAKLGTSEAERVVAQFNTMARDIAFKYQAQVDKVEGADLTLIVGLPVAGEDDASQTVRMAVSLIEALDAIADDTGHELRLAVGIQRGAALLTRGAGSDFEYDIGEVTTSIARKLATSARGSQIIVGGAVYRVANDEWAFAEAPSIEIPGDGTDSGNSSAGKRARVYRLEGRKAAASHGPSQGSDAALLGRELEVKALRDAFADVLVSRRKRHVMLVGEAGTGKRRIVDALLSSIPDDEAVVVRATARVSSSHTPFAIVAECLRRAVGSDASPQQLREWLRGMVRSIHDPKSDEREYRGLMQIATMLLGLEDEASGEEIDAEERRQRLIQAMLVLERKLPAEKPLVVVCEEAHWSDEDSMDLLVSLLGEKTKRGVLAIVTTRPETGFVKTAKGTDADILQIDELNDKHRLQLFRSRFAPDHDVSELARQVLGSTGGNPLFIRETIDTLVERGILVAEGPDSEHPGLLRWVKRDAPIHIPTSIEALLATRLDQLPQDEKETLMHAAILGKSTSAGALEGSMGRKAESDLNALLVRGILRKETEGYVFKNEMTMQVTYSLIPFEQRVVLHRRAAERLSSSPNYRTGHDDAIVAHHLEQAGDEKEAAERYLRAAGHAVEVGGNAEAYRLLTRTLKLLPENEGALRFDARKQREEILRRLARRPAQLREIHHMVREAETLEDASKIAAANSRLAQFYIDMGRPTQAMKAVPAALDAAKKAGDKLAQAEALRLQAAIARLGGEHEESLELSNQALKLCTDDRDGLLQRALILNNLGTTLWNMGLLPKASEAYAEGLVIYRMLKLPRQEAQLLNNMGIVFSALGEYEEALAHFKSSLKLDQELGDRAAIALKLGNIGQTYSDLGDTDRGNRYLEKALKITKQTDDRTTRSDVLISLGQCYIQMGKAGLAVECINQGLRIASESRDRYQEVRARIYLALAQLESGGPPAQALELARSATELAIRMPMPVGEVYGLAVQGLALAKLDRADEGAALAERAVERQDRSRQPEGSEEILHIYATLAEKAGDHDNARSAITRAHQEVVTKAKQLRDKSLRTSYLGARVPRSIQADFERLTQ